MTDELPPDLSAPEHYSLQLTQNVLNDQIATDETLTRGTVEPNVSAAVPDQLAAAGATATGPQNGPSSGEQPQSYPLTTEDIHSLTEPTTLPPSGVPTLPPAPLPPHSAFGAGYESPAAPVSSEDSPAQHLSPPPINVPLGAAHEDRLEQALEHALDQVHGDALNPPEHSQSEPGHYGL